jgi:hypothetical protein
LIDLSNAASKEDKVQIRGIIAIARALLNESAILRYHSIRTILLLATLIGDTKEAEKYLAEANILLRVVRANKEYGNPEVDKPLAELKSSIAELQDILAKEFAADYVVEDSESGDDVNVKEIGEDLTKITIAEK